LCSLFCASEKQMIEMLWRGSEKMFWLTRNDNIFLLKFLMEPALIYQYPLVFDIFFSLFSPNPTKVVSWRIVTKAKAECLVQMIVEHI